MCTDGFELVSSALTSSTLKWLHRIQCGFNSFAAQIRFVSLLCPQGVNATDLARTVYSGIPDDVIFIDTSELILALVHATR
jgi:hypothetical protein